MKNLLLFALTLFLSFDVYAGNIKTVKGKKVLIEFEDDEAAEGDVYFAFNPKTNSKTAIIEINKVKGTKAVGVIKKGNAKTGYYVERKITDSLEGEDSGDEKSKKSLSANTNRYGFVGNLNSNSMSATITSTTPVTATTNMKGTSFGLGGFYNFSLGGGLYINTTYLYEMFKVAGNITADPGCTGSTVCTVDVNYLSGYALFRYNLNSSKTLVWVAGGLGFLMPLSSASNALSKVSLATVPSLAIGADISLGTDAFLPVWFQYNMFQDAGTVKSTNMIQIYAGYGWSY